jgi:hypothetical protein
LKFIETASPAASSAGELIFDPDESRASECERRCEEAPSKFAVDCAIMFVLMTIRFVRESSPCGATLRSLPCCTPVYRLRTETLERYSCGHFLKRLNLIRVKRESGDGIAHFQLIPGMGKTPYIIRAAFRVKVAA